MKLSTYLQGSLLFMLATGSMQQHALATEPSKTIISSPTNEVDSVNDLSSGGDEQRTHNRFLRGPRPHPGVRGYNDRGLQYNDIGNYCWSIRDCPSGFRCRDNTCINANVSGGCPGPSPGQGCTMQVEPVLCNGCVYSNMCFAQAAGMRRSSCISTDGDCPEPNPNRACITIYAPVNCNGCIYSNMCLAQAAGIRRYSCRPTRISTEQNPTLENVP